MSDDKCWERRCRACLVTGVRMFNIHDVGMAGLFGFLAGSPMEPSDGLPQNVCYYCRRQLEKFKEFRQKYCQTTTLLQHQLELRLRSPVSSLHARAAHQETDLMHLVPADFDKTKLFIPLSKTNNFIFDYIPKENNCEYNKCNENDVNQSSFNCLSNSYRECDDLLDCDDGVMKINDDQFNNYDVKSEGIKELDVEPDDDGEMSVKSELIEEQDVIAYDIDEKISVKSEAIEEQDIIDDNDEESSVKSKVIKQLEVLEEQSKEVQKNANKVKTRKFDTKTKKTKKKTNGSKTKNKQKQDKTSKKKKCNKYNEKFEEDFLEFSEAYDVKVVCLSKEEQIRKVQERKESKEFKDSRFTCDVCYKWFMSETAYKRHMKTHDPSSGAFVCDVCQMRYATQHTLNTHKRTHKKIFKCNLCDQANISMTRAKLHSRWHKGVKFECNVCHKQFNANTTYLSHMREMHKAVRCDQCGQTCQGTNEYNKHRSTLHKQNQNDCDKCGVVFKTAEALDRHRRHAGCSGKLLVKLKPCLVCGENFTCRASLAEHLRRAHSGRGEVFTCEQCQSVFTSDRALSAHFASAHYSLKPRARRPPQQLLCECCAKSFPTALRLKQHHRLHSDERPYQCTLCPKRLKTKAGLEFHVNSHTGQRPYRCRLCPEAFKSHAHRHNHQVMKHTTRERCHKCQSCDKSFVSSSDLKKHVRYVHLRHPRPHQPKLGKRPHAQDTE